jgi:hypothetical protein
MRAKSTTCDVIGLWSRDSKAADFTQGMNESWRGKAQYVEAAINGARDNGYRDNE